MFSRMKAAAAAAALLGGLGAASLASAGLASASVTSVSAHTYVSDHPDTTNGSGGACTWSLNGYVWARDAYTSHMTAVKTGASTWQVTLRDSGRFDGFADPNTCAAADTRGSLTGLYTLVVTSATAPSRHYLHSSYAGNVSTTKMVNDFFNDAATSIVGGDYFFSYQNGNYVQTTSGTSGDVKPERH